MLTWEQTFKAQRLLLAHGDVAGGSLEHQASNLVGGPAARPYNSGRSVLHEEPDLSTDAPRVVVTYDPEKGRWDVSVQEPA